MHRFLIGYDLDKPGTDYSGLICDIETNFSSRRHDLDSTWVVKSELSADDIRDLLKSHIDANDRLLVIKLTVDIQDVVPSQATDRGIVRER